MNLPIRPRLKLRPESMRKTNDVAVAAPPPPPREEPDTSIDSIIHRTRPVKDRFLERERREIEQQIVQIELREEQLDRRYREMREMEMRLREQERNLREESMLLAARVSFLEREAAIARARAKRSAGISSEDEAEDRCSQEQELRLKTREDALNERAAKLHQQEEEIARREEELRAREDEAQVNAEMQRRRGDEPVADDGNLELLSERERFIEESENVLFQKAQELQERETYIAHVVDQLKVRGISIEFPFELKQEEE